MGRCEVVICGVRCPRRAVHTHHRKYRSRGGTDNPINLIEVCRECHDWIHTGDGAIRSSRLGQPLAEALDLAIPRWKDETPYRFAWTDDE